MQQDWAKIAYCAVLGVLDLHSYTCGNIVYALLFLLPLHSHRSSHCHLLLWPSPIGILTLVTHSSTCRSKVSDAHNVLAPFCTHSMHFSQCLALLIYVCTDKAHQWQIRYHSRACIIHSRVSPMRGPNSSTDAPVHSSNTNSAVIYFTYLMFYFVLKIANFCYILKSNDCTNENIAFRDKCLTL